MKGDRTKRQKLIDDNCLLDVRRYRFEGLSETPRKYKKEPSRYRLRLIEIYDKLSDEDLQELLNIKEGR